LPARKIAPTDAVVLHAEYAAGPDADAAARGGGPPSFTFLFISRLERTRMGLWFKV
jgi:hypothetical protein